MMKKVINTIELIAVVGILYELINYYIHPSHYFNCCARGGVEILNLLRAIGIVSILTIRIYTIIKNYSNSWKTSNRKELALYGLFIFLLIPEYIFSEKMFIWNHFDNHYLLRMTIIFLLVFSWSIEFIYGFSTSNLKRRKITFTIIYTVLLSFILYVIHIDISTYETQLRDLKESQELFNNSEYKSFSSLLEEAKVKNKPLLLYFTKHSKVECRAMTSGFLSQKKIRERLKQNSYFKTLYIDEMRMLDEKDWLYLKDSTEIVKTVGERNRILQYMCSRTHIQPNCALFDLNGNLLDTIGYTSNEAQFMVFLNKGVNSQMSR